MSCYLQNRKIRQVIKAIRRLNFGWILILVGTVTMVSGLSMKIGETSSTLLCFDEGCIYVQAISNILMGIFIIGFGIYMIVKR